MTPYTEEKGKGQAQPQHGTQHTLSIMRTLHRFYQQNIAYADRTQNEPLRMVAMDGARRTLKTIRQIEGV